MALLMDRLQKILLSSLIILANGGILILSLSWLGGPPLREEIYDIFESEVIEIRVEESSTRAVLPSEEKKTLPASISLPQEDAQPAELAPTPLPETLIYDQGLKSSVNLLCKGGPSEYVVATGAIIDSRGYLISNAHVAEGVDAKEPCTIRRGSPAQPFREATLIYTPISYKNATSEEEKARSDFSIWKINEPGEYPVWELEYEKSFFKNELLLTLAYPAELLGNELVFKSLNLIFSKTYVEATDTVIIRSTANISSQRGSSGGVLIDPYTMRIRGLIFAVSENTNIAEREIFSLTPKGINEIMQKETGKTLKEYLAGFSS